MANLDFIKNTQLKETLDNAVKFIYVLYEQSKNDSHEELYLEETYRIIILYVVSAIEAILLYFYKERGELITSIGYRSIHTLPGYIHKEEPGLPVVICVQKPVEKKEHQIGLYELVVFFKSKKLMQDVTADKIIALNEVRNTLHFSKPRIQKCDLSQVENALGLLVHTLENAPRALAKK